MFLSIMLKKIEKREVQERFQKKHEFLMILGVDVDRQWEVLEVLNR